MALVTISEAARLAGRARTTIQRDVRKGRLSQTTGPDGRSAIDTAELMRAYGALQAPVLQGAAPQQAAAAACSTPAAGAGADLEARLAQAEGRAAEAEVRAARAEGERDALREQVAQVREDAAHWRAHAGGALRQLEDLRVREASTSRRRWWPWGRRASGAASDAGAA